MATRQAPVVAFPFTALVSETGVRQAPVPGTASVSESASATVATPVTQVSVAT